LLRRKASAPAVDMVAVPVLPAPDGVLAMPVVVGLPMLVVNASDAVDVVLFDDVVCEAVVLAAESVEPAPPELSEHPLNAAPMKRAVDNKTR